MWLYDPSKETFVPRPAPGGGTFGILELPAKRFAVHRASDGEKVETAVMTAGVGDRRRGGER